jgi:hypothetical protein
MLGVFTHIKSSFNKKIFLKNKKKRFIFIFRNKIKINNQKEKN